MKRRLRFHLVTMLAVVTLIACGLAHLKPARDQRRLVQAIQAAGGEIHYHEYVDGRPRLWTLTVAGIDGPPPRDTWRRRIFGDDYTDRVAGVRFTGGAAPLPLDALARLPRLQVEIFDRSLAASEINALQRFDNIYLLVLKNTNLNARQARELFSGIDIACAPE